MATDNENTLALALEILAQEICRTIPASNRPAELQTALGIAFNALGLFATQENTQHKKGVTP